MFRVRDRVLEALLAHPGGPFWRNKDLGAWTIPKGEIEDAADPLATARREFEEEMGFKPTGPFFALGSITQKSGKVVHAWAFRGDCDPSKVRSNVVEIEWAASIGQEGHDSGNRSGRVFQPPRSQQKAQSGAVSILDSTGKIRAP